MTALTFVAARTMAEWGSDPIECIVCGGEPTHLGLVLLKSSNGLLASIAWCNKNQDCIDDAATCAKAGTAIIRPITP